MTVVAFPLPKALPFRPGDRVVHQPNPRDALAMVGEVHAVEGGGWLTVLFRQIGQRPVTIRVHADFLRRVGP